VHTLVILRTVVILEITAGASASAPSAAAVAARSLCPAFPAALRILLLVTGSASGAPLRPGNASGDGHAAATAAAAWWRRRGAEGDDSRMEPR